MAEEEGTTHAPLLGSRLSCWWSRAVMRTGLFSRQKHQSTGRGHRWGLSQGPSSDKVIYSTVGKQLNGPANGHFSDQLTHQSLVLRCFGGSKLENWTRQHSCANTNLGKADHVGYRRPQKRQPPPLGVCLVGQAAAASFYFLPQKKRH